MRNTSMVFHERDGVLVAPASCGLLTVPDLISHVRAWCAATRPGPLVVDLSEVDHVDTVALRSLVWARRYCTAHGTDLQVVPPREGVLEKPEELMLRVVVPVTTTAPAVPDALLPA